MYLTFSRVSAHIPFSRGGVELKRCHNISCRKGMKNPPRDCTAISRRSSCYNTHAVLIHVVCTNRVFNDVVRGKRFIRLRNTRADNRSSRVQHPARTRIIITNMRTQRPRHGGALILVVSCGFAFRVIFFINSLEIRTHYARRRFSYTFSATPPPAVVARTLTY